MADYITLTTTRTTRVDTVALLAAVKSATGDATAVLMALPDGTWRGKKANTWSAGDISAAQNALDTTAELTPQLAARQLVDNMSIYDKAQNLAIIDTLNTLRGFHSLGAITPTQALNAIRAKADTL